MVLLTGREPVVSVVWVSVEVTDDPPPPTQEVRPIRPLPIKRTFFSFI